VFPVTAPLLRESCLPNDFGFSPELRQHRVPAESYRRHSKWILIERPLREKHLPSPRRIGFFLRLPARSYTRRLANGRRQPRSFVRDDYVNIWPPSDRLAKFVFNRNAITDFGVRVLNVQINAPLTEPISVRVVQM